MLCLIIVLNIVKLNCVYSLYKLSVSALELLDKLNHPKYYLNPDGNKCSPDLSHYDKFLI